MLTLMTSLIFKTMFFDTLWFILILEMSILLFFSSFSYYFFNNGLKILYDYFVDYNFFFFFLFSFFIVVLIQLKKMNSGIELFQGVLLIIFLFTFTSTNFLSLILFFECVYLVFLVIILTKGYNPERLEAILYLMFYGMIGASGYLLCICGYNYHKNFVINYMFGFNYTNELNLKKSWLGVLFLIYISLPFLMKLPIFGFHSWLPKAHVEAPTFGSMLLAGILLKLGYFSILRLDYLMYFMFFKGLKNCFYPFFVFLLIGIVILNFTCSRQSDLKSFIAYSSVVHMSLISLGLLNSSNLWWYGGLFLSFSHAFASSALFLLAGLFSEFSSTRNIQVNRGYYNILSLFCLFLFSVSLLKSSFPGTLKFLSEILLSCNIVLMFDFSVFFLMFNIFYVGLYSIILYLHLVSGKSKFKGVWVNKNKKKMYLSLFFHIYINILMFFFVFNIM